MTDPSKDFRYTIGDQTVEGYQITEVSRFQEKLWPDWLNSNQFMTIDGHPWITLNGEEEVPIPDLAWVVKDANGIMSLVDALDYENYVKVVPEPEYVPSLIAVPTEIHTQAVVPDKELLLEVKVAFEMLQMGNAEEALKALQATLSSRADWCECAPGQCEKLDMWGCREKSPLVKKPRKARKKATVKKGQDP
jgi:hypothetical protein